MARRETCKFHTQVDVTSANVNDVNRIIRVKDPSGGSDAQVGDIATLDYSVHITYLGPVAGWLGAMLRLKANFVGNQRSTAVLIKRVFDAFDKAIR